MRRKILFFMEIVILLFLFLACLRSPATVFEGGNDVFTKDAETGERVGGSFRLTPGVYRICVQAEGEDALRAQLFFPVLPKAISCTRQHQNQKKYAKYASAVQ